MKKATHMFYITVIALLLVMNVSLYFGKSGAYSYEPGSNTQVSDTQVETSVTKKINLNKATVSDLVTLDGIGYKTAENIIARRNEMGGRFKAEEDLLSVNGIGSKKFDSLKEFVYVDGAED